MQVKNYGDGCKKLISLLLSDNFSLSIESACSLYAYVGKEDALEWGVIRTSDVSLHQIAYRPPTKNLTKILQTGFDFLANDVYSPEEPAIGTFLFMARNQLFYDANKKTASLMMNGCLLKDGYFPITVLNRDSEIFLKELGAFYETGNANVLFRFFERCLKELYSEQQRNDFPSPN